MAAPHLREELSVFLIFRFNFAQYFERSVGQKRRVSLERRMAKLHLSDRLNVCVPRQCCRSYASEPSPPETGLDGLHLVLWSLVAHIAVKVDVQHAPVPL